MPRVLFSLSAVFFILNNTACQKSQVSKPDGAYTYVSIQGRAPQKVYYEDDNGYAVVEEDILLGSLEEARAFKERFENGHSRNAVVRSSAESLWDKGTVPFKIPSDFLEKDRIFNAMQAIEREGHVHFVPAQNEKDFLDIVDVEGRCSSHVGKKGGAQRFVIGSRCAEGSVMHELMHSLGVWHEQSRSDREKFIVIHTENIKSGKEHDFQIETDERLVGTYDFGSIMHYSSRAFSKNGLPTITRLDGSTGGMGQREELSRGDIEALHELYGE